MDNITKKRLLDVLLYEPVTGVFTVIVSAGNKKTGDVCGSIVQGNKTNKYLRTMIDGKRYRLHRLAWLYMTGTLPASDMDVDHIDGNGLNNIFDNLRVVSRSANCKNCKSFSSNTSGVNGVHQRSSGSWRASIRVDKVLIHLGTFKTKDEASAARENANVKYGFSETHGKR
jgi:hypothetical protein